MMSRIVLLVTVVLMMMALSGAAVTAGPVAAQNDRVLHTKFEDTFEVHLINDCSANEEIVIVEGVYEAVIHTVILPDGSAIRNLHFAYSGTGVGSETGNEYYYDETENRTQLIADYDDELSPVPRFTITNSARLISTDGSTEDLRWNLVSHLSPNGVHVFHGDIKCTG